ncbi:MAG: extracellular solute-binding protein, partial [Lachnospiraceae bacterium]|nr:extracellular solute-binding protein [Lachnospiraceae bacterium]
MRGIHLLKTCVSIVLGIILLSFTFFGSRLKGPEPSDRVRQKDTETKDAQYDVDYYLTGGKKDIIRIASWYNESYLRNLTSYLSRTFPDIEFEIVYIDKNHYSAIIDTQLSYKGAPDIIYVNRDLAKKHAYTRYIIPLTDICGDFEKDMWDSFAYGNQIYAVPNTTSFECIYYNIDLFEEAGIGIPENYQDFLNTALFINKVKGMKVMSAGLKDYESVANSALAYLQGSYFETDKGKTFGKRLQYKRASFFSEMSEDLKEWQKLIDYEVFRPEMCTMDKQAAIDEFSAGESFLLIAGPEDYNRIKMANKGVNIGTMPLTAPDTGHPLLIGGCSVGFAVNASSRNVDLAKEVVAAMASY